MPIPVTPRFKRLLDTANPEQKKALGTSSVQSDSDTGDYHREKRAAMPQAIRDIENHYQDTEKMTPGEKYQYEFEKSLRRFRDRYGNDKEVLEALDVMENAFYTNTFKNKELLKPVAQPAPDPFDKEANAVESIMGLSDILPDAVYQVTGSDLAAFASGFLSPSKWIKGGARTAQRLYEGQELFRWVPNPDRKTISRRLDDPGNEFGMHVGTDRSPGEDMSRGYSGFVDESGMMKMKAKVKNPLWLPDTGRGWHPETVVDSIITSKLQGNLKFSDKGIQDLYKEQKNWRDWLDTYIPNWTKELHNQEMNKYTKKVQRIIKSEGYDHISYENTVEGNIGKESAIIFDKEDIELLP